MTVSMRTRTSHSSRTGVGADRVQPRGDFDVR